MNDLVTAQEMLRGEVKAVLAPALRRAGFTGSQGTWVLRAPNHDCAVVNLQSSGFGTAEDLRCVLNLALIPAPWWDWLRTLNPERSYRAPKEQHGLWRRRLLAGAGPADPSGWWVISDATSAHLAVADMVEQLRSSQGLPLLLPLLDRTVLLDLLRGIYPAFGTAEIGYADRALAVLLAQAGPSEELVEVLDRIEQRTPTPPVPTTRPCGRGSYGSPAPNPPARHPRCERTHLSVSCASCAPAALQAHI